MITDLAGGPHETLPLRLTRLSLMRVMRASLRTPLQIAQIAASDVSTVFGIPSVRMNLPRFAAAPDFWTAG
jgi:hypothetical protein